LSGIEGKAGPGTDVEKPDPSGGEKGQQRERIEDVSHGQVDLGLQGDEVHLDVPQQKRIPVGLEESDPVLRHVDAHLARHLDKDLAKIPYLCHMP